MYSHSGHIKCVTYSWKNTRMKTSLIILLFILPMAVLAQRSDFNDRTPQGWDNGNSAPDPTIRLGGPDGDMDPYLRVSADGDGAGGRAVVFNSSADWTGDKLASFDSLRIMAANFSDKELTIRITISGAGEQITSNEALDLAANDESWVSFSYALDEMNFSGGNVVTALSSVTKVEVFHGAADGAAPFIEAEIGLDNVEAFSGSTSTRNNADPALQIKAAQNPVSIEHAALLLTTQVPGNATLDLFDSSGRQLGGLTENNLPAGTVSLALPTLPAGIVIARLVHHSTAGITMRTIRFIAQ